MVFTVGLLITASMVRLVAPHVRRLATARELKKQGMTYEQVASMPTFIDGAWLPEERGQVHEALLKGDLEAPVLKRGFERIEALRAGGCPSCTRCKKLFPSGRPPQCDRCGGQLGA